MQRSHGDFSLIMEIQPGVYHYKFIVDNQWRCAPDQKYVRDANGAYSNVLDVRSHSYQQVTCSELLSVPITYSLSSISLSDRVGVRALSFSFSLSLLCNVR